MMPNYFETMISGNQWLIGTEAAKPAAGTSGRFYYTTDTRKVFYDNGAAWIQFPTALPALSADIDLNSHNLLNPGNLITLPVSADIDLNSHNLLNPGNLITLPVSADIDLNSHKLVNIVNPSNAQDAATKAYVDSAAGGGFQSGFQARVSSSYSFNEPSDTIITFDTEIFDGLGEYNPSTYRFTAQSAGRYLINVIVAFYGGSSDERMVVRIYKNGSVLREGDAQIAASTYDSANISVIEVLSAGDYIEVKAHGGTVSVKDYSYFSMQRVY